MMRGASLTRNPTLDSIRLNTRTVSAGATATSSDYTILCDASGGAFTLALPAAASVPRQELVIKKIDASANVVTVDPNGSETIDGALTMGLSSSMQSIVIQSNGVAWFVLSAN